MDRRPDQGPRIVWTVPPRDGGRTENALEQLRDHSITLRRAAEIADLTYVEMLSLATEEGIDTGYITDDLARDLKRL